MIVQAISTKPALKRVILLCRLTVRAQGNANVAEIKIIPRRDVGDHIQLLPPERFSPALADADCYYDAFEGRQPPQRGRRSRALNIVMVTKCAAWDKLPSGKDLYDAFHAEPPSRCQIRIVRTFFDEGDEQLLIQAWAQQAFSHRTLIRALHRAGCTTGNTIHSALLIQLINHWAQPQAGRACGTQPRD